MGFSEQRLFHSRQFIISIFFRITCVCSYCICLVIQLIWEPKRKHVVGERREREKKREQAEKEKSKEICAEVSTVLMPYKQHVVYACFFFFGSVIIHNNMVCNDLYQMHSTQYASFQLICVMCQWLKILQMTKIRKNENGNDYNSVDRNGML